MIKSFSLKKEILGEIEKDFQEYCFDRSYCSDKTWIEQNGNISREEAYKKDIHYWLNLELRLSEKDFILEVQNYFDDKYNYLINKYTKQIENN